MKTGTNAFISRELLLDENKEIYNSEAI